MAKTPRESMPKKPRRAPWDPSLSGLPTELLKYLPGYGLSSSDLYGLVLCGHRFSAIYAPFLHKFAIANRGGKTALRGAIEENNVSLVRYLLLKGHDEMPHPRNWRAFEAAFYYGNLEVIKLLVGYILDTFPDDLYDFADQASSGLSCLVHYTGIYDYQTVEMLLCLGADPNGHDPHGYKIQGMNMVKPISRCQLLFDIKDGDIMRLLIERGGNINHHRHGETVMDNAIKCPENHGVVRVLLEEAAKWGKRRYLEANRPFHAAAEGPYPDIANILIQYGYQNKDRYLSRSCFTPAYIAAKSSKQRKAIAFMKFLLGGGIDINEFCLDDDTPLLEAATHHHWRTVRFLITRGAHARVRDNRNRTVFHLAVLEDKPDHEAIGLMLGRTELGEVGYTARDMNRKTAFEILYGRTYRDFMKNREISIELKPVFHDVMEWLSALRGKGGDIGESYRWLWGHAERAKKHQPSQEA